MTLHKVVLNSLIYKLLNKGIYITAVLQTFIIFFVLPSPQKTASHLRDSIAAAHYRATVRATRSCDPTGYGGTAEGGWKPTLISLLCCSFLVLIYLFLANETERGANRKEDNGVKTRAPKRRDIINRCVPPISMNYATFIFRGRKKLQTQPIGREWKGIIICRLEPL
jgi:hypothetical protein